MDPWSIWVFLLSKYSNLNTASTAVQATTDEQGEEMEGNYDIASIRMGSGALSASALCCCQEPISNMARTTFVEGQISLKKGKSGCALQCILASNWWTVKRYLNRAKIFSLTKAIQLSCYKTLQVASFMLLRLCFGSPFLVAKGDTRGPSHDAPHPEPCCIQLQQAPGQNFLSKTGGTR